MTEIPVVETEMPIQKIEQEPEMVTENTVIETELTD